MRLMLITTAAILAGCSSASGVLVTDEDVSRLKVGATTLAQAVAELGPPTSTTRSSEGHALVSYSRAQYSMGALVMRSVMLRFGTDGVLAEVTLYDSNSGQR
jgi:hypothetical protein